MEKLELKQAAEAFAKANNYWRSNKTTFQHTEEAFMAGAEYVMGKDAEHTKKLEEALQNVRPMLLNIFGLFGGGQQLNKVFDYINDVLEFNTGKEAGQDV